MPQIRRRFTGAHTLQVETRPDPGSSWKPLSHLVALGYESPFRPAWELNQAINYGGRPGTPILPMSPLAVRLCDGDSQERVANPLSVVPTGSRIPVPAGTRGVDYVPRLGAVIGSELHDASPEAATRAISTFVLMCEFTLRGGDEAFLGVTPVSLAEVAVPGADLIDSWRGLLAATSVNGQVVAQGFAADSPVDLGELISEASEGQRLLPGEIFAVDVLAGAAGAPLVAGDHLVIAAPRLGRLEHHIG